ncbi:MAG: hypothetical protein J5916_01875 [Oscillospiraceae bacterium]|nr:hypothetical protein [Oscillospiraceae bacterium]
MSEIYTERLTLRSRDVDMFRHLRTSELFKLLQEASIRHTEQLGMGRDKTLDKGILWVLLMQRAEITRMPEYDERIVLRSWPGKTMHLLFPRFYSLETEAGEGLVKASALWGLVDAKTRKAVFPERYGVEIAGMENGEEIDLPGPIRKLDCDREKRFEVPYSYVDLNGHMNNTRYFDLAEDCVGAAVKGRRLKEIRAEYVNEARIGEALILHWNGEDGEVFLSGESSKAVFRMTLRYE